MKRVLPSLHRAPTSALGTSSMAGLEQKLSFRSLAHDMNMHGARPSTALGYRFLHHYEYVCCCDGSRWCFGSSLTHALKPLSRDLSVHQFNQKEQNLTPTS